MAIEQAPSTASTPGALSIVLPAKNEAPSLETLLPRLSSRFPGVEIVVVDDGSTDETPDVASAIGACVVSHPYSMGNGAAIKSGARAANGDTLVFMDADGQHDPKDVPRLLEQLETGYDMAVGARGAESQASMGRSLANRIYNRLASLVVGHSIRDLTSGFRAVRAARFKEFLHLLPNGFSYPTTITIAFFRAGYPVSYVPITAARREGKSHIRPLRDGARFLLIIFRVATLYSPLKVFIPTSFVFLLLGVAYGSFTIVTQTRFTNMSALLLAVGTIVFLMGLVSEQITALMYQGTNRRREADSRREYKPRG